jgi:hypothetical protein
VPHHQYMGEVLPLPNPGDVFDDVRDNGRTMRVSYHAEAGVVVVSLWAGALCRASFRLASADVARLAEILENAGRQPVTPDADELRAS